MGAPSQISKADYYRRYADELRAIADCLRHESHRLTLQRVADDFDRMAIMHEASATRSLLEQRRHGVVTGRDRESYAGARFESVGPKAD